MGNSHITFYILGTKVLGYERNLSPLLCFQVPAALVGTEN